MRVSLAAVVGRVTSDDRVEETSFWRRPSSRALAILVIAMVTRMAFRATYLVNWDAVNFAMGVEAFDLEHHQPHPPGYLGYVLLGRLVRWVVGDPVLALTAISVVSGALATMWVYILGRRIVSERAALVATVLFGTSPLVWYYSGVALTYIVEVALALPLIWVAIEARSKRTLRLLLTATALLALMGALRQTSLVLFLPVWLYAWWPYPRRQKAISAGVLTAAVLVWLIPLLIMSGGPLAYLRLSSDLAQLTGGATWLGAGAGIVQNIAIVATGLVLGLHVALLAVPLSAMSRYRSGRRPLDHRRVLYLWAVPPLFVYLFIHSGQLGYVLVLLPVFILWAAQVFESVAKQVTPAVVTVSLLVIVNVAGFTVLPELAYGAAREGRIPLPDTVSSPWLFERGIRQASIPRSDSHWEALIAMVESYDPETTAVLAEPRDGGSFRHVAYYLPEYRVYGIGSDRDEFFGHLFTGSGGQVDYSVERLAAASTELELPEGIDTLLIPDSRLQEEMAATVDLEYELTDSDTRVAVARVREGSSLLFLGEEGSPVVVSESVGDLLSEDLMRVGSEPSE